MVNLYISPAEESFITAGINEDLRNDGRKRTQFRDIVLETGILANASGSCRLKIEETEILIGIKVEIENVDPETPNQGRFACNVDWYE